MELKRSQLLLWSGIFPHVWLMSFLFLHLMTLMARWFLLPLGQMQLTLDWLLVADVHLVSEGGLVDEVCIVGEASLAYVLLMASYVILLITPTTNLWNMTFTVLIVLKVAIVRIVRFCNGRWLSSCCIGGTWTVVVVGHAVLVSTGREPELASSSWETTCLGKLFLQFQIFIDRYMCPTIIMRCSFYISLVFRWQCDLDPTSGPWTQFTFPIWGLSIVHHSLLIGLWKRASTTSLCTLLLLYFDLISLGSLAAVLWHLFLAELRAGVIGHYADFSSS